VGRKRLPAGMRAPLPLFFIWLRQCFPLALGLNFFTRDARLFFQQLQLEIAQLLAARSVPGDAAQTQVLFSTLIFICAYSSSRVFASGCRFSWALISARKASECGGSVGWRGALTMLLS